MSAIEIHAQGVRSALEGVAVATKITTPQQPLLEWLGKNENVSRTVDEWLSTARQEVNSAGSEELLTISLAIAWLRVMARADIEVHKDILERIWSMIRQTIRSPGESGMQFSATRSSQGFMAVPLCSLIKDGRIQELWRFHCWLPDGKRGREETRIHSHQSFGQSWILAGNATNISMGVESVNSRDKATHAYYEPVWTDSKNDTGRAYKTHLLSSTVANTKSLVNAHETHRVTNTQNQSYAVPAGAYHQSNVQGDQTHATLFAFDSERGYQHDASILGPVDGSQYTELRDSAGITPIQLVEAADDLRQRGSQ